MISSLTGTVSSLGGAGVEIEVGGVGYLVLTPTDVTSSVRVGDRLRLLTQLVVREDSMTLYGFVSEEQRQNFGILNSVTGVGPKMSLAIQSAFSSQALAGVVTSGDVDALQSVPGVGKRTAQRIVLELKDKLVSSMGADVVLSSKAAEVREALLGLGYTRDELRGVLDQVAADDAPVEEMVRAALKELART